MSDAAHARDAERGMRLESIPSDRQKKGRRKQGASTSTRAVQEPATAATLKEFTKCERSGEREHGGCYAPEATRVS